MSGPQISTRSSYLSETPDTSRPHRSSAFCTALTKPSLPLASAYPALLLGSGFWAPHLWKKLGPCILQPDTHLPSVPVLLSFLLSSPQTTWARNAESLDLRGGGWRRTISCQEAPPSLGPGAGRPHYLSALLGQAVVGPCCDKGHRPLSPPSPPLPALPESARRPPACFSRLPR